MGVPAPRDGVVGRGDFVSDEVTFSGERIECLFDGCGVKVEGLAEVDCGAGQEVLGEDLEECLLGAVPAFGGVVALTEGVDRGVLAVVVVPPDDVYQSLFVHGLAEEMDAVVAEAGDFDEFFG